MASNSLAAGRGGAPIGPSNHTQRCLAPPCLSRVMCAVIGTPFSLAATFTSLSSRFNAAFALAGLSNSNIDSWITATLAR